MDRSGAQTGTVRAITDMMNDTDLRRQTFDRRREPSARMCRKGQMSDRLG
jgi:hypothetical protein